jgi:type IV pilus assembly protein PilQ
MWGCGARLPSDGETSEYPSLTQPHSTLASTLATNATVSEQDFSEPYGLVADIMFAGGEYGELILTFHSTGDIPWQPVSSDPGRMRYFFPGMSVPPSLAKVYQLHEFSHPVKNALLRNADQGAELIITTTGPVTVKSESRPGALDFRFGIPAGLHFHTGPQAADLQKMSAAEIRDQELLDADSEDVASRDRSSRTVFPGMDTDYKGKPISIDVQNIEVEHVLRLVSEVAGYNLILDPEVSGKISMKLDNVPWDQVLDLVLIQKGLGKVQVGNILRISTIQRLGSESKLISDAKQEAARARIVEQELEPVQTAFIQINYATAAEMDNRTRPFLTKERGNMTHDARTNMLIVTDVPANIRKVRGVVERLDRPERQVLIEARVVYATDSFQRGMGIQWGGGIEGITTEYWRGVYGAAGGGTPINQGGVGQTGYLVNTPIATAATFGLGGFISKLIGPDMFTLDAQLQLGEVKGESKVISSPRIVTLNNQRAEIEQGTSIPYTSATSDKAETQWKDAVLKLEVTPQITPDDNLILDLFVSDDNPKGENIEKKHARTKLLVENGQILVLGGVLKSIDALDENRVPGLADVPFLGWLFKSRATLKENQELLIFIRPTIL